jgi:hypothetical protein
MSHGYSVMPRSQMLGAYLVLAESSEPDTKSVKPAATSTDARGDDPGYKRLPAEPLSHGDLNTAENREAHLRH